MAPMKRKAGAKDPIKSRCALIKKSIDHAEECPDRVKEMLARTLSFSIGTPKADRHPFNERFVAMIEQVLQAEHSKLKKNVAAKEAAFTELTPAKATRETGLEQAQADAAEKKDLLEKAKQAVTEAGNSVKEATAELGRMRKAQKAGDEELEDITAKRARLEQAQKDGLAPIEEGADESEQRDRKVKAVLSAGKSFGFDPSLMSTAVQVLQKPVSECGAFDMTCLEQLKEAFVSSLAKFDEQLAAGAPGKAERASAVEQAFNSFNTAVASENELKEKAASAKEAKVAADAAAKSAAKSLADFLPDLKACGDALDEAKKALQSFADEPQASFAALKEFKEDDFKPKQIYYEKIDGLRCDRAVIDACRAAVMGTGDGRVSVDDAKNVFEKIADGGKETRAERWTLCYCLQEFNWTEAAHDWIVEELKKVPQEGIHSPAKKARTTGDSYYEVIDGFKCDRAIVDTCREAIAGQGDGRISVEDANKVWEKVADGNKVTDAEKWTLRHCLSGFNWSRPAHDWLLEQLRKDAAA